MMQPYFSSITPPPIIPLYFQKQNNFSAQCGACALNNLLGANCFNANDLNKICYSLSDSVINPYKSVFGGDYDVTVLINAIKEYQIQLRWLKKNEKISDVLNMENINIKGFLLNIQQTSAGSYVRRLLRQSGRHWVTIKTNQKGDNYILLDSLTNSPYYFKDLQETQQYLEDIRKKGNTILVAEYNLMKIEQPVLKQLHDVQDMNQ